MSDYDRVTTFMVVCDKHNHRLGRHFSGLDRHGLLMSYQAINSLAHAWREDFGNEKEIRELQKIGFQRF